MSLIHDYNVLVQENLKLKQEKESLEPKMIRLESDLAYAIGHTIGCGHPCEYLEKQYPELHKP